MPVAPPSPCIELAHVSHAFDRSLVLDDVSFTVQSGEYLGIIGPNGSGKTTLMKIIVGLIVPDRGEVKVFGSPLKTLRERYLIGYVPQRVGQADLQFPATVSEVVASGRTARVGIGRRLGAKDRAAVRRAIAVAGVEKLQDRLVGDLSGGERQRVYIARALAGEPKLLVLDEPTVGVDASSQETFYKFLDDLNHREHLTILVVSHDIDVVAHEARCIVCLNRKLVSHGTPGKVLRAPVLRELYGAHFSHIHHAPER